MTREFACSRAALNEIDEQRLGNRKAKKQRRSGSVNPTGPPQETTDPGSATSYVWCYGGLNDGHPYNVFDWTPTREHATVGRYLTACQGTLVGDAFGGNARVAIESGGRIRFAARNAHARREFIRSEKDESELSAQAISFFRQLYAIEERSHSLPASER